MIGARGAVSSAAAEAAEPRDGVIRAFIDLGTNSVRLSVVRFEPGQAQTVLAQRKQMVRLGEGQGADGRLQPEAMRRAAVVCREFAEMARGSRAASITAIATSATRDAVNQAEFLDLLRREADLEVEVVSGREEARLIYMGVAKGENLGHRRALFIDIGGGSTELIVGNQREALFLESLKLGAIRLTGLFFRPDETGPVSDDRYALIKHHVAGAAVRALGEIRALGPELVLGSSGTIETLADIAVRRELGRPLERSDRVGLDALCRVTAMLRGLSVEQRRQVPGLGAARADIIIAGAAILETVLELAGQAGFQVSDRGLRDGLVADAAMQEEGETYGQLTVRERSVLELGRACRFDERHHRQVARLALSLFDGARELGLHALDDHARELLEHAAMLHDIGVFLSYNRHQNHSCYLIANADLLGFNQRETAIIAAMARFHRRGSPSPEQPVIAALDAGDQLLVTQAAIFLRLAERLDRSHAGRVAEARLSAGSGQALQLTLVPSGPEGCQLERWGLEGQERVFERVFGRGLVVVMAEDAD